MEGAECFDVFVYFGIICIFTKLVDTNLYPPFSFGWLDNHGNTIAAVPFKVIGFAGSLANQVFPGKVGTDGRVACPVRTHPADHGIRIDADGLMILDIA